MRQRRTALLGGMPTGEFNPPAECRERRDGRREEEGASMDCE